MKLLATDSNQDITTLAVPTTEIINIHSQLQELLRVDENLANILFSALNSVRTMKAWDKLSELLMTTKHLDHALFSTLSFSSEEVENIVNPYDAIDIFDLFQQGRRDQAVVILLLFTREFRTRLQERMIDMKHDCELLAGRLVVVDPMEKNIRNALFIKLLMPEFEFTDRTKQVLQAQLAKQVTDPNGILSDVMRHIAYLRLVFPDLISLQFVLDCDPDFVGRLANASANDHASPVGLSILSAAAMFSRLFHLKVLLASDVKITINGIEIQDNGQLGHISNPQLPSTLIY